MKMKTPKLTEKRIKEYLAQGKRFDGRKPEDFRDIKIEIGISKNAEGSARVKLGKTDVIVGVKLGAGEPYPDSPGKGNLMTTTELLPLSSPRFELGPPKINSIELARVIDRMVRESKFIDLEKLCIKKGEKVWTVFLDIYSINDDGNLLDAAGLGAVLALKNAKMPKYDTKNDKILHGELSSKNVPLGKNVPLSITLYKIGDHFIVDPTKEEEDICEARVTIGSHDGTIYSMQKGEEEAISIDEFNKLLDMNEKISKDIFKKIGKFLK